MTGRPCLFGEVLFDCFEDGRRVLGGAPFNVAWHLAAFGEHPVMISRVGADEAGEAVERAMQDWGMDRAGLQHDPSLPTGTVQVAFVDRQPEYDIVYPSAWDAIEDAALAAKPAVLYHGTLALRDERSRAAWRALRARHDSTVFVDVNLRAPWWSPATAAGAIGGADWLKLNREELDHLAPGTGTMLERAEHLRGEQGLQGVVLTDGANGAFVLSGDDPPARAAPPRNGPIVDTVGAGDALAAVMLLGLLRNWPVADSLERAQAFASAVCTRRGATIGDPAFYRSFLDLWPETDGLATLPDSP